jgi:hypothetical protein
VKFFDLTLFTYGDKPIGRPEVVIIEDPDMGKFGESCLQVLQSSRISRMELFERHIVPSLRNSHRHAFV